MTRWATAWPQGAHDEYCLCTVCGMIRDRDRASGKCSYCMGLGAILGGDGENLLSRRWAGCLGKGIPLEPGERYKVYMLGLRLKENVLR